MSAWKRTICLTIVALSVLACRTETEYGKCVGLNDQRDSTLVYRGSTRNIVIAVVFVETIFVPVIVALNEYACPVARRGR